MTTCEYPRIAVPGFAGANVSEELDELRRQYTKLVVFLAEGYDGAIVRSVLRQVCKEDMLHDYLTK